MPVGRLPHMYHNGLPNQMQVMPNAVNVYPANSSTVPRADGATVSNETWSDALSKLPASSAPSVTDHRPPVRHLRFDVTLTVIYANMTTVLYSVFCIPVDTRYQ